MTALLTISKYPKEELDAVVDHFPNGKMLQLLDLTRSLLVHIIRNYYLKDLIWTRPDRIMLDLSKIDSNWLRHSLDFLG